MACLGKPSRNRSRGQVCGGTKAVPSTDKAAARRDWCGNWVCGGVDVGSGSGVRADVGSCLGVIKTEPVMGNATAASLNQPR